MSDITPVAREIAVLAEEGKKYYDKKAKLLVGSNTANGKKRFSKGAAEKEASIEYKNNISRVISKIRSNANEIYNEINQQEIMPVKPVVEGKATVVKKELDQLEAPVRMTQASKTSVDVDEDTFERFVKSKKKGKKDIVVMKDYSLYEQSSYGRLANTYVAGLSQKLIKEKRAFFEPLFKSMRSSDFQILANTYVSIIIFTSMLAFIPSFLLAFILIREFIVIRIFGALATGVLFSAAIFWIMYLYPSMIVTSRKRYMEADLPFVVVHMAAVAGSGAHPMAMFNLVLSSGEYKGLESEIKKIINYVNLFGYNLTTSLRLVAITTPLKEFSELLSGIVTTIETGGDLKDYLSIKAEESMEGYEAKRKRYIQNIATFSDIYIGISVVAPMLLFFLLSLINSPFLGGSIGGISASTLALFGTYVAIPVVNIIFLVILNVMAPK